MTDRTYAIPPGGLPPQSALHTGRAVFTEAYALIPAGTMRDITASFLPHWEKTRLWIIARPMTGFAETFSHYVMEMAPGGRSIQPEPDGEAEGAIFVTSGALSIQLDRTTHVLEPGGFAYLPPRAPWTVENTGSETVHFHFLRKRYDRVEGLEAPSPIFARDQDIEPLAMPDTGGRWATTRFMDPDDLSHDMHVTIVTLEPGAVIPFEETHVMEHGLYVLQGKGVYRLNRDWAEVEAGDYMWLRAFCPQACYAGGPEPFRYLLYKDVNRHPRLDLASGGGR
ncbi:MAG: bifunctional allantoicase/(S)-ureidoglycine aminohydrolase [Pseudomonadota bacterium]